MAAAKKFKYSITLIAEGPSHIDEILATICDSIDFNSDDSLSAFRVTEVSELSDD